MDATATLTPEVDEHFSAVEDTMRRFDYQANGLVEVLITAQREYGFLSKDLLTYISKRMHLPLSRVYGVATFYDMFNVEVTEPTRAVVCTGPVCSIAGAKDVVNEACARTGTTHPGYTIKEVNCLGLCDQAPAALVKGRAQVELSINDVPAMLRGRATAARLHVCGEPRVLTHSIGRLDPTDLEVHLAEGAFITFEKAVRGMTPEEIIGIIDESRLTGRGGAGFEAGTKWRLTREAQGTTKYIVCNFDESEPGTFKDRVLMEGDPFRVLEGMSIAAFAVGAHEGVVFARGEYEAATEIVEEALDEMYTAGLLGHDIFGTGFDFNVEIRHNAGAYICGEETALLEAIEGNRGHPRLKPPYPAQRGLFGNPTLIHNVETLAVVPSLIHHGGAWFRQWGTESSPGLKLFSVSGHVARPGVVEAPFGLTVRQLIERFAGGFDGEPQAVLVGGAAGGFLHPDKLDVPLTHEDLSHLEVPIGSGAVMVFNQSVDLWQVLQRLAHFFVYESCGKCAPCRLGTSQIYELLEQIGRGTGTRADLHELERLGELVTTTCACGLGRTAANPVLTVLHQFEKTA